MRLISDDRWCSGGRRRSRPSPERATPGPGGRAAVPALAALLLFGVAAGCAGPDGEAGSRTAAGDGAAEAAAAADTVPDGARGAVPVEAEPDESRLRNLRMLTFRGQNAEAYFSPDEERLIFQATRPGAEACDQIFVMGVDGTDLHRVSTGEGRTTCGYFFPSGERILYASTHARSADCPPRPDYSRGYVWALYDYDIYTARPDGSDLRRLTDEPGYDAEATVSPDGSRIVFTSVRDGDLEIYTMAADGSDVRRLTHEEGYDGGAFFSPDGTRIVYRAHHPATEEARADYRALLREGLVRPSTMEIYVMDADGSNRRRITDNGAANFAPFFHPDGRRIIFSSNLHDPRSRNFDLYLVGDDGSGLERVTTHPDFDSFPMFTRDGRTLAFASNRYGREEGDTNIFLAEWVETTEETTR